MTINIIPLDKWTDQQLDSAMRGQYIFNIPSKMGGILEAKLVGFCCLKIGIFQVYMPANPDFNKAEKKLNMALVTSVASVVPYSLMEG